MTHRRNPGFRRPALVLLLAGAILPASAPLLAQDTTVVADTLPDPGADSLQVADSLQAADSLAPADTVIHALMPVPGFRPADDPALVARWNAEELVRARGLTLLELLSTLPGTIPIRTADYGSPEGIVLDGMAGGRLRVFRDGVEEPALDGSVVDLARVTLAGVAGVEVIRAGGEIRIFLTSRQPGRPQPESVIEAGTGDLDTNVFRGSFYHPDAFGGGLSLLFERVDSDGRGGNEAGSLQTVWARFVRPLGDRIHLAAEIHNRPVKSVLERTTPEAARLTRAARVRARLFDGVTLEAFASQNNLELTADSVSDLYESYQLGGRLAWGYEHFWGRAAYRHIEPEWRRPTWRRADLDLGFAHPALGGVSGRLGWDQVFGRDHHVWGASAWTRPVFGVSLMGALDRGVRGWGRPAAAAPDSVRSLYPISADGTFLRAGARVALGPLSLEGAWVRTGLDRILPLGNRVDQGVQAFPGDTASGFTVSGSLDLPLVDGLSLDGSLEQWEEEGILRPEQIYRGGLSFHDQFYPTGNLEITASALVEGRTPMLLPLPDPDTGGPVRVPFYQSWNVYLQIRVVTVRVFIRWDNLFLRPENQDLPGRILPRTRAMYGVRWTLTN